jgi:hypothetical protein
MIGYATKAAANGERLFLRSSDLWIRQVVYTGEADVNVTGGSPNSVVITVNGSTPFTGLDLEDGKLVIAGEDWVITSETNNTVTATRESATVVVDDTDVQVRVMSALRFAGYSEGKNFALEDEYAEFKDGVPRKLIAKDLVERSLTLSGNLMLSGGEEGFETFATMSGMAIDTATTDKFRATGGSNPAARPYFEVVYKVADRSGKDITLTVYYGQFEVGGEIGFDDEEYKRYSYTFSAYSDPLRVSGTTTDEDDLFEFEGED